MNIKAQSSMNVIIYGTPKIFFAHNAMVEGFHFSLWERESTLEVSAESRNATIITLKYQTHEKLSSMWFYLFT